MIKGTKLSIALVFMVLAFSLVSQAESPPGLEPVISIEQLTFELDNFIGKKAWVSGYYGDQRFTGDGVGFLVTSFHILMIDEQLPRHSFIRLDGKLPPLNENGAEILVYGEVKNFGKTYGVFTIDPTPLVTVEKYRILKPSTFKKPTVKERVRNFFKKRFSQTKAVFKVDSAFASGNTQTGTAAGPCDRALIISGGIDANDNHARYRDNMIAKFKKLKELGFTDEQINVLYNDGAAVDSDGTNIVDSNSSKATISQTLERISNEMRPSCTLTIFVTDHGTGYNRGQGWHGARPAFSGERGLMYPENSFTIDLRQKVYRETVWVNAAGERWWVHVNRATDRLELYKREGDTWVRKGEDANGDGRITESETDQDIDGDGDKDDVGWTADALGEWRHRDNEWDTDGDGTNDVRARWDGTRYVFEIFKDGAWHEIGRDGNDDFILDNSDGGIDWNLDGDKDDQVGFHEGINLWGREVLWDDELAEMLKRLSDKGIHIVVEMVQCFGGGFVENLEGIVEKIVTGSSEDTKHWNRLRADGTAYAADEMAFLDNLDGIDLASWNRAFDRAIAADRQKWQDDGSHPESENHPRRWEKPFIDTGATFFEENGEYTIILTVPENMRGRIYDIELFFGLQAPRWQTADVMDMPEGCTSTSIPGGIRIERSAPFGPLEEFKIRGERDTNTLNIHLTDNEHKNLGNTTVTEIPVPEPPPAQPETPRGTVTEGGEPGTTTEEGPPGTVTEEGPPSTTTEEGPPGTVTEEGPPSTTTEEGPPGTVTEEGPPSGTTEEGPPVGEAGPPGTTTEEGPPSRPVTGGEAPAGEGTTSTPLVSTPVGKPVLDEYALCVEKCKPILDRLKPLEEALRELDEAGSREAERIERELERLKNLYQRSLEYSRQQRYTTPDGGEHWGSVRIERIYRMNGYTPVGGTERTSPGSRQFLDYLKRRIHEEEAKLEEARARDQESRKEERQRIEEEMAKIRKEYEECVKKCDKFKKKPEALTGLTDLSRVAKVITSEHLQYKRVSADNVTCDAGIAYKETPTGMDIEVSSVATGKGADFRKWDIDDIKINVDGEVIKPSTDEACYIEKDSYFRGAAAATFVVLGAQYSRYAKDAESGEVCHVTGESKETSERIGGIAEGIDRAGMAAGLGLLAAQAKGAITGRKVLFKLDKDKAKKIAEGKGELKITTKNEAAHQERNIKVPLY